MMEAWLWHCKHAPGTCSTLRGQFAHTRPPSLSSSYHRRPLSSSRVPTTNQPGNQKRGQIRSSGVCRAWAWHVLCVFFFFTVNRFGQHHKGEASGAEAFQRSRSSADYACKCINKTLENPQGRRHRSGERVLEKFLWICISKDCSG